MFLKSTTNRQKTHHSKWLSATEIAALALFAFFFVGCSSDKNIATTITDSDEQLYTAAKTSMYSSHKEAIAELEKIENYYPASPYAIRGRLLKPYLYYINYKFDDAQIAAESFLRDYPAHQHADYVYYLRAMALYMQVGDVSRDQDNTVQAITAMQELRTLYPSSEYAADIEKKLLYSYALLAGKEMEVGRFYQKNNNLIAALNRFKYVIEHYDGTAVLPEALYRAYTICAALGLQQEQNKYLALLKHNYPESAWLAYALSESVEHPAQTRSAQSKNKIAENDGSR